MVFIKKRKKEIKDYTIADIIGRSEKKGHVGLEIELEGANLNKTPVKPWVFHQDNSLRGRDNAEYVVDGVLDFSEVDKALDDLWEMHKKSGAELDESDRTSVHVHLNVGPFFQNRLTALMSLWFIFEDVLTHWCGEGRVGNHYCLTGKDAPAVVHQLKRFVRSKGEVIPRDNFHYAAFNANAIAKFGSVEIRTLRGVNEPGVIKTWVKILKRLYDLSENYTNPHHLIEEFSLRGPVQFFEHVFGGYAMEIMATAKLTQEQLRDMMYEGMRNAQDISYARDWVEFKPTVVPKDPFGRKEEVARGEDVPGLEAALEVEEEQVRVRAGHVEVNRIQPFAPAPPRERRRAVRRNGQWGWADEINNEADWRMFGEEAPR